jgi:hypothetical protein
LKTYQSKRGPLGTSYAEAMKLARREYHVIQKRTPRRQAYVRSAYFKKDKIFINQFWVHLDQKSSTDRLRRLKLFACAIDVIRNCPNAPEIMQNPNKADEALYRYHAQTNSGQSFSVQIRENKTTGCKDFMSVFPDKKSQT